MINYLERLREYFIDSSGWDKMGRKRPTNDWADERINELTNVELLEHIGYMREDESQ